MKQTRSVLTVIALLAASSAPSFATEKLATGAMMPKCAVADQVVMVNTASKTYKILETSSTATSRQEKAKSEAKTNVARMNKGMKPMCKSKADAMGAKMIPGAMKS